MKMIFRLSILCVFAALPLLPQEEPPSNDMDGYCSGVKSRCQEQCLPAADNCVIAGGGTLCEDQFQVCYEDCVGWFDGFWCGYRAY